MDYVIYVLFLVLVVIIMAGVKMFIGVNRANDHFKKLFREKEIELAAQKREKECLKFRNERTEKDLEVSHRHLERMIAN